MFLGGAATTKATVIGTGHGRTFTAFPAIEEPSASLIFLIVPCTYRLKVKDLLDCGHWPPPMS
jgi:hypothetical protein